MLLGLLNDNVMLDYGSYTVGYCPRLKFGNPLLLKYGNECINTLSAKGW